MKELSTLLMLFLSASAFAQLTITPEQTAGPYYPGFSLVESKGADLTNQGKAKGDLLIIYGQVLSSDNRVIPDAHIHIWQTDGWHGRYFNDERTEPLDPQFHYFGLSRSDQQGNFTFSTVRPIEYPAGDDWVRPDHIHIRIYVKKKLVMTTQLYFSDDPLLGQDLILQKLTPLQRDAVIIKLRKPSCHFCPPDELTRYQRGQINLVVDHNKL